MSTDIYRQVSKQVLEGIIEQKSLMRRGLSIQEYLQ